VTRLLLDPVPLIAVRQPAPGQVTSLSVIFPVNVLPSLIVTVRGVILAPDASVSTTVAERGESPIGTTDPTLRVNVCGTVHWCAGLHA
jgi:hypothetical protein